jgi:hypothetical protein
MARNAGQEANARIAAERAAFFRPVIAELQAAGRMVKDASERHWGGSTAMIRRGDAVNDLSQSGALSQSVSLPVGSVLLVLGRDVDQRRAFLRPGAVGYLRGAARRL